MTLAQAVKLALKSVDKELQRLAFDANLFELAPKVGGSHGERMYKKRARLLEARAILARLAER